MSIQTNSTSGTSGTSTIQELARTVMREFDGNKDGQFSFDEFANFLDAFVQKLGLEPIAAATTTTSTTTTASQPFMTSLDSQTLPDCLPGWDATKWADPGHTTPKYVAGRVLARYAPSDWLDATKRDAIVAQIKAAGLDVTAVGKDKIEFSGGQIDIVTGANDGGRGWQWLPVS